MSTYRNISFAAADSFRAIREKGRIVTVRQEQTQELRNWVTTLLRPTERCLFLPGRNHDIFAQIAETMWVVAGRSDLPWLTRYLWRAPQFSDDNGATWHGAYGPRLRCWPGEIDQLGEWRRLLAADPSTRRAAGVLFDPARDYIETGKDIPCNNWLSWLSRDGKLNLSVAIRSNDAMWGFSGINAFEWSIVQEMLAFWIGMDVGDATYVATSYHLYDRDYARADKIVRNFLGVSPYDFGIASPRFSTPWSDFPRALQDWFVAVQSMEIAPGERPRPSSVTQDPLLENMLALLRLKWGSENWPLERLADELSARPENDFTAAAYEHFGRTKPSLLEAIPHARIAAFFSASGNTTAFDEGSLKNAIKHLHARKNASYAGAWKKRGERVSILPNIARKVDRLLAFSADGTVLEGESALDTAIDLFVYAIKYVLFLAEHPGSDRSTLPMMTRCPLSDFDENFDALMDEHRIAACGQDMRDLATRIHANFETMWQAADAGADLRQRQQRATNLMGQASELVALVATAFPAQARAFVATEQAS